MIGVNVVDEVKSGLSAGKEEDRHTEEEIFPADDGFETTAGRPLRDDRCAGLEDVGLGDGKRGAEEHHGHSHTEQHTADETVEHQEYVVSGSAVEVTAFATELVADGLKHEAQQYEHPQPIGAAEARGVEQGKRGEEGAAKHYERSEREFPLAAKRVDHQLTVGTVFTAAEHRLSALDE